MLHCDGVPFIIHYLDDFLALAPAVSAIAASMRPLIESSLTRVGAPLAHQKTEGPTTTLTFLGIQINTISFQLSLPADKVARFRNLLGQWRRHKSCTKRDLESLVGHLSHVATVIHPGRIFLRNFISLLARLPRQNHITRLNLEARTDITWWRCLLDHWNGCSFILPSSPSLYIFCDASGSFGCGASNPQSNWWFQLQWPAAWTDTGIMAKELVPIVLATAICGAQWSGKHICFCCDNDAVVTIIQNR